MHQKRVFFFKSADNILQRLYIKVTENIFSFKNTKPTSQQFYANLLKLPLTGMNIGTGGNISADGELNVMHHIKDRCSPNKETVIFDVGANVGNYTNEILKEFNNINFQLYSFEPSKDTFLDLKKHFENVPNLRLYNVGFGEKCGVKTLFYDKRQSGLASVYNRRLLHFNIKMKLQESIKICTIDDFCKSNRIQKIDFLKLDVEGNEFDILKGAKKMIENDSIRFIQFEFGGCNIDSRTYFQDFWYLLSPKYRIYRILKNGVVEILRYEEILEIFLTTNFLAEIK